MGPPGAGKGTQAQVVADRFGIPAISTGDIFRSNVSRGTELGVEAKRYMDAGEYVPDSVTNLMVRHRIDEPDAEKGFLLDGYPRTLAQVDELDGMIKHTGHRLDAVIVLTVDPDELVRRLTAVAACSTRWTASARSTRSPLGYWTPSRRSRRAEPARVPRPRRRDQDARPDRAHARCRPGRGSDPGAAPRGHPSWCDHR